MNISHSGCTFQYFDNAASCLPCPSNELRRGTATTAQRTINSNAVYGHQMDWELRGWNDMVCLYLNINPKDGRLLWFSSASHASTWLIDRIRERVMGDTIRHAYEGEPFGSFVIYSPVEHRSITELLEAPFVKGVEKWSDQKFGNAVSPDSIKTIVSDEPDSDRLSIYAFYQAVNPVTGHMFDIKTIRKELDERAKILHGTAYLLCDMTAYVGKTIFDPDVPPCVDALWFSGHKFGTEKGIGCLWLSNRLMQDLNLTPTLDSRNQYGLVHGTVPTHLAKQVAETLNRLNYNGVFGAENLKEAKERYLRTWNKIQQHLSLYYVPYDIRWEGNPEICLLRIKGVDATALTNYLAEQGVYVSPAHSACEDVEDNHILHYFGITENENEWLRLSLGPWRPEHQDVDYLIDGIVEFWQKYMQDDTP